MSIRHILTALGLSTLTALAALATPSTSSSLACRAELRAQDDERPPTCPLCGGTNFSDFAVLTRLQKQAAIVVALTI